MATSKLKQNIRYKKADQKLAKERFSNIPQEKKLVLLHQQQERLEKWQNMIWSNMYKKGFKPMVDNQNPKFYGFFDELANISKMIQKTSKSISNLENKGFKLDSALENHYRLNAGRMSQSF